MSKLSTFPVVVWLALGLLGGVPSEAAILPACTNSAVTITSITRSDGTGAVYTAPPAIPATTCVPGSGNDTGTLLPGNNRGELNDGLLNGAGGFNTTSLVPGSQFLDLDNNGSFLDPGWIRLGGTGESFAISYETVTNALGVTRSVSDFLTLTFSQANDGKSGQWGLNTNTNIVAAVQAFLGRSTFDHLAIILKGGNNGYVVYDFNFAQLALGLPPGSFDFLTAYSFAGDWSTVDLLNTNENNGNTRQAELSHISFWARDPISTGNQVPEPGTLALLGLGLAALGVIRHRNPR